MKFFFLQLAFADWAASIWVADVHPSIEASTTVDVSTFGNNRGVGVFKTNLTLGKHDGLHKYWPWNSLTGLCRLAESECFERKLVLYTLNLKCILVFFTIQIIILKKSEFPMCVKLITIFVLQRNMQLIILSVQKGYRLLKTMEIKRTEHKDPMGRSMIGREATEKICKEIKFLINSSFITIFYNHNVNPNCFKNLFGFYYF
jgi:hypothetical protein